MSKPTAPAGHRIGIVGAGQMGREIAMIFALACAPEVGSEKWCAELKEKPKGDWSTNEVVDYAKHCVM